MQPAIAVDQLFVQYKTKRGELLDAVKSLSFQVQDGEIVGFLGPNGAGKSSTLKALMGFVTPKSGQATIFGAHAGTPESRRQIGYLPEVAMYYPFLTPVETLTMYGELQGLSGAALKTEIYELLEMLGIAQAAKKLNRSMSKGMLQRVGIAQALLGKPKLLILDEVTSGLDPVGRKELRNLLIQRQKEGATLFFSSHELAEVDMLCDRIILINKGEFVEERMVAQLKDELRNFSLVYEGVTSMTGLTDRVVERDKDKFESNFDTKESMLKAIERIQMGGGRILDVISQEGSLENYFVETVEAASMKFVSYRALARSVVLESLRRKDLWVVAILGFLIILCAGTLGFFGFDGLEIFAKDLAVTVLGLFSTIIAVLTSFRLIPDEIKNRTLYPLLARPITRFDLLVGKFIGAVIVTWISFLILCALTAVALMLFHVQFNVIMAQFVIAKMLGLVVVCALSMTLSVYLTSNAAATLSFILAFGSPMIARGLTMSAGTVSPITKFGYSILNGILPQVQLFDMGGRAVYPNWTPVPIWVMGFLLAYGLCYSFAMLGLGWVKFRKQAI